jgi:hypothetical protein
MLIQQEPDTSTGPPLISPDVITRASFVPEQRDKRLGVGDKYQQSATTTLLSLLALDTRQLCLHARA